MNLCVHKAQCYGVVFHVEDVGREVVFLLFGIELFLRSPCCANGAESFASLFTNYLC